MPTKTIDTYGQKKALEIIKSELAGKTGVVAKEGFPIAKGDVIGIITTGGKARRRTRASVTGTAFATNSATGTVDDASVFAVGDVIKNAAGADVGTILSINTSTNTITLAANAAVAVATGANVFGSDGSQVAKGIADNTVDGVADTSLDVFVCGLLDEAQILRLDATAKTELAGASMAGGIFKF